MISFLKQILFPSRQYTLISKAEAKKLNKLFSANWAEPSIPTSQRRLVDKQLGNIDNVAPFKAAVSLLKQIYRKNITVLEVGCSSGYYNEVFQKKKLLVKYQGCDYSSSFINLARQLYPKLKFYVCDANKLTFKDKSFDLVFSAGCLLHILDYDKAVKEAIRVSKRYVIFHRQPTVHSSPNIYTTKKAYGQEVIEIFFNEESFIELCIKNNLTVIAINTHSQFNVKGVSEPIFMKSYLCQKK